MRRIRKTDAYDLWIGQIERPLTFMSPFGGQDFALLLVIADAIVTDDERDIVSKEIVRQGCRYAVCTGQKCSRWHDSIDFAFIATDPEFTPPDERFIMTTWHDNEPLEDVAFFFRWNTAFDNFVPKYFLVLVLGDAKTVQRVASTVGKLF